VRHTQLRRRACAAAAQSGCVRRMTFRFASRSRNVPGRCGARAACPHSRNAVRCMLPDMQAARRTLLGPVVLSQHRARPETTRDGWFRVKREIRLTEAGGGPAGGTEETRSCMPNRRRLKSNPKVKQGNEQTNKQTATTEQWSAVESTNKRGEPREALRCQRRRGSPSRAQRPSARSTNRTGSCSDDGIGVCFDSARGQRQHRFSSRRNPAPCTKEVQLVPRSDCRDLPPAPARLVVHLSKQVEWDASGRSPPVAMKLAPRCCACSCRKWPFAPSTPCGSSSQGACAA
jgi:hypothetical protein